MMASLYYYVGSAMAERTIRIIRNTTYVGIECHVFYNKTLGFNWKKKGKVSKIIVFRTFKVYLYIYISIK